MSNQMDELDLKKLESRVDDLIKAVERLQQENKTLRTSQTSLLTERTDLIEKTEMARTKVEAMIKRLKALEND
jgi:cell division protein ZapB